MQPASLDNLDAWRRNFAGTELSRAEAVRMILTKEFVANPPKDEEGIIPPTMPFNLNNFIRVRPTAAGRAILQEEPFGHMLKVESDGSLYGRIWQVMVTFGPYMASHLPPPIDENIELIFINPSNGGD